MPGHGCEPATSSACFLGVAIQASTGFSISQSASRRAARRADALRTTGRRAWDWVFKAGLELFLGRDFECAVNSAPTNNRARENQTPPTSSSIFIISGTFRMPEGTCAFVPKGQLSVNPDIAFIFRHAGPIDEHKLGR